MNEVQNAEDRYEAFMEGARLAWEHAAQHDDMFDFQELWQNSHTNEEISKMLPIHQRPGLFSEDDVKELEERRVKEGDLTIGRRTRPVRSVPLVEQHGDRLCIPVCQMEVDTAGTTIWVHDDRGRTVLRIKGQKVELSRLGVNDTWCDIFVPSPILVHVGE